MIYLAFGSNLKSRFGNSVLTIQKSYSELEKHGIEIVKKSSFYKFASMLNERLFQLKIFMIYFHIFKL